MAGSPDQVDLTITVVEKPTGNLSLGLSFSSTEKLALSASIRQENVFGSGNYLGLEAQHQPLCALFGVQHAWIRTSRVDGVSRALDLYYRTSRPFNSLGDQYQIATPGAAIRFGVPFSEYDTVFFGIGAETTEIKATTSLPNAYFIYRDLYGSNSSSLPLTIGWARDNRDSVVAPTFGRYARVNLEWSAAGDVQYLRSNFQVQQYVPFTNRITLGLNAELGIGKGLGGKPYPVFKNFYGGGLGSVRVFEQNSLGVIDPTGAYIGGAKKFNGNAELYFPVPGTGNDKSLRIFAFTDVGNVWREDEQSPRRRTFGRRLGFGLSWISPVGPLKMSWGKPVKSKTTDRIQQFQFQIGTAF